MTSYNLHDQMSLDFYNTNLETGKTLSQSRYACREQQAKVLRFFRAHPDELFSAEDIMRLVLVGAPRSSAGRCLTNLTIDGFLEKTTNMVVSSWNKQSHTWRLNKKEELPMTIKEKYDLLIEVQETLVRKWPRTKTLDKAGFRSFTAGVIQKMIATILEREDSKDV